MPVGVGVLARQERGRLGTWIGGLMKMVPYRMGLSFGDESLRYPEGDILRQEVAFYGRRASVLEH